MQTTQKPQSIILPVIVIAQFCCTSLWFAGNAVMTDLVRDYNFAETTLGHLTSSVQFGFIAGTLVFAILTIADRYSPSRVFLVCAGIGAVLNFGVIWEGNTLLTMLSLRFFTGFCLAGIYPVGMKIAADYFEKGLGKSLGFLVGALVVGTAFPHLLKGLTETLPWRSVLMVVSVIAFLGGIILALLVPDGPYRKKGQGIDISSFFGVFASRDFRSAAFGYFGHMWELYAFWAFVPVILKSYQIIHPAVSFNIPILSFVIIGIGGLSCVVSGYLSQMFGVKRVAFIALLLSCLCCLVSPFAFGLNQVILFVGFLMFWGMVVIADSPLFSTLVAQNASSEIKGTALTIVNCIGFAVTILSIQLINLLTKMSDSTSIYALLAIGPIAGLLALSGKRKVSNK